MIIEEANEMNNMSVREHDSEERSGLQSVNALRQNSKQGTDLGLNQILCNNNNDDKTPAAHNISS